MELPNKAYFIGIGGIGMSALAQLLAHEGVQVSGSDRERSAVTEMLEQKGIGVAAPQRAENVPADAALVVYSDAVPAENPERARAAELCIPQKSYFAMLGAASAGRRTVAVAGTHGKTTTTGMLAAVLAEAGAAPTAVIGSIVRDFGSNYLAGGPDLFVVEACEYRDHLLELSPEVLVITNLEWDHTDWFPSLAALQETFRRAIARVPPHGAIVTNPRDPNIAPMLPAARARVVDYACERAYATKLPGAFNVENARAAAAAARAALPGVPDAVIAAALARFSGTWRRFEYKGTTARAAEVYDDYAHHPTAVKKTLEALRARSKGRIFVAFHPHLFSRTRDLFEDFSRAFADADEVFIAPIYAARETDDGSVSSEKLASSIRARGVAARAASFAEIERALSAEPRARDTIITMGAGDIYKVADALVAHTKPAPFAGEPEVSVVSPHRASP